MTKVSWFERKCHFLHRAISPAKICWVKFHLSIMGLGWSPKLKWECGFGKQVLSEISDTTLGQTVKSALGVHLRRYWKVINLLHSRSKEELRTRVSENWREIWGPGVKNTSWVFLSCLPLLLLELGKTSLLEIPHCFKRWLEVFKMSDLIFLCF